MQPARTSVTNGTCEHCGGKILDDGFCGTCGQKARSPRDHWTEQPAPWVGGVCDKGSRSLRQRGRDGVGGET